MAEPKLPLGYEEAAKQTIKHLMRQRDAWKLDAERYRKVEAWMKKERAFTKQPVSEAVHGAYGIRLRGPTFDAAVDALPEPNA